MPEVMSLQVGERYHLLREIATVGNEHFYEALDVQTSRRVGMKIVEATGEELRRFERLGQDGVLSGLLHRNILPTYSVIVGDQRAYLITAVPRGRLLSDVLRSDDLNLYRVKALIEQMTHAVGYAHEHGVVHGSLSPSVVFVEDGQVQVSDFAVHANGRGEGQVAAAAGLERLYLAPEQLAGAVPDARSDVYSIAAILYQASTGAQVDDGRENVGPLAAAFEYFLKTPLAPSEINGRVPADWDALILSALAQDPGKRFSSARELAAALSALSTDEVEAVPPELAPAVPSFPDWLHETDAGGEPSVTHRLRLPRQRLVLLLAGALVGLIALGIVLWLLVLHGKPTTVSSADVLKAPIVAIDKNPSFQAGKPSILQWMQVLHATMYRVQIAAVSAGSGGLRAFEHPTLTTVTHASALPLPVVPDAHYRWRVQALVDGQWSSYEELGEFTVTHPLLPPPALRSPADGATRPAGAARFCWSTVSGASSYSLRIDTGAIHTTRSTCATVALDGGRHRWNVAAEARGTFGPFSRPRLLTLLTPSPPPAKSTPELQPQQVAAPTPPTQILQQAPPAAQAPAPSPPAPASVPAQPRVQSPASQQPAPQPKQCIPFVTC